MLMTAFLKALLYEESFDSAIPGSWSLFQAVKSFLKLQDFMLFAFMNISFWLLYVYCLLQFPMKKRTLDV
jgi:hypothetical protein